MHVVFLIANNSSVPYFNWFAEEAQKHEGIKISFVALHHTYPQMINDMKERGCDCYWVPFNTSKKTTSIPAAIFALYWLFRKIKPDLIHSHLFDDAVPSLIAARLAGVKHRVITKQDTAFHWYYAPKGIKYDRLNNRNATRLIAVSEECRSFIIEKEKADSKKISMIHHGIDMKELTQQHDEVKMRLIEKYRLDGRIVIGTIARLIEWKGYKDIIKAAAVVTKERPEILFLFTGQGDQETELKQLAKAAGLENNITFTGWVDRIHIPSLYGIMDIYLHAAAFEPFGFVIAEAMVNGVPVISTRTGSARDAIVHQHNGYLVDYNRPDALAEGIFFMLTNDRRSIGAMGKETAMRMFNFEVMWRNYIDLYSEMNGTKR